MKEYTVLVGGKEVTVKADKFHQVDGFVSFYAKNAEHTQVVALICMAPSDCIIERR